ncbi:MAG: Cell division protein FtsL [Actinomycetota bacterium]|jgi:cell division protein FtsL
MTSVRVHTRTKPAPAPAPKRAPARPPLRVVPPDYVPPRVRRRRARLLVAGLSTLVALGMFGIVSLHVALTQGQFRLERLEARADEQQTRYEQLRLQVAELESPDRVVAVAQERLGMVSPPGVTYLSPSGPVSDGPADNDVSAASSGSAASWNEVKPHLDTGQ